MAAIADADVSIDVNGNIRWTGAATTNRHSILEFIQWLMDKQDDGQAAGDDLLDITVDTPFDRSTDQIVTLNWPFNIDDTFATHLYDGSVQQALDANNANGTLYSGLEVIGPVETGTEYMILQAGRLLPAFWGTGVNPPGGASLVFSRHLVKSREGGADIDGKRIVVLARELGDQFRRFPVTLGTANSVAAIGNGADVFNTKSDATLAGYTDVVNTEGFQELDIDGTGAAGQEFYSQWDKGTRLTNDVYEVGKWIAQRSHTADSNADTGSNFIIDNATILGQGQEFTGPTNTGEIITGAELQIKIGAGTPTGEIYCEIYESDDVATAAPTGAVLARSEPVIASAITSTYETIKFQFDRLNPNTGVDQRTGLTLATASDTSFLVVRHPDGTATDYFHVHGLATTGTHGGNRAEDTGTWAGVANDDLWFTLQTSPAIHGIPGDRFEGISAEIVYDTETGTGVAENDVVNWGTEVVIDTVVGTFIEGEHVRIFANAGTTVKNGGQLLYTNGTTSMIVSLDNITSNLLDNDDIVGVDSGATAKINVTITNQNKAGGTGLLLAKDDNGVTGDLYIQLITGVNPVDNSRIYKDGGTANYVDANVTITSRTLSPEFHGTSTGSNIIGAYGVGYDPADVGSSDRFTSLDNTSRVPPNNVVFTVSGLVSGEDRVLVGPRTGTALDRGQWLLNTTLSGATETSVVVKTGTDTVPWAANTINWPSAGGGAAGTAIRIELDTGIYRRIEYSSHNSSNTFTIPSTDFTGANQATANNDVFMAFIDALADATSESFTGVHGGVDRDLFVRVRDGGATPIKTFESTAAQFLSTPQTIAAIRTSDA